MFKMLKTFFSSGRIVKGWRMEDPAKKGGSYSIYFKEKHITSVRGKMKALVLINAIQGVDISDKLEMPNKTAKNKRV